MIGSITSMLANAVMVFIFTFFIALERHNLKDFFYKIIPTKISLYIQSKESEIVYSISTWFR
jgi:predicted PurR-regulated permease PerM